MGVRPTRPEGSLSRFGRRLHKLIQLVENPKLVSLYRRGVGPESYARYNRPWFKEAGITTVIDIGANVGQFAVLVHSLLPGATIYAFEPLPDCYQQLARKIREMGNGSIAFNVALGRENSRLVFHRNPYSDSSSFRSMMDIHRKQFPFTAGPDEDLDVPVRRLDSYASELDLRPNVLLKIDVQGFEDEVLAGAEQVLRLTHLVQVEVSMIPLYEDSPSFTDVLLWLERRGFSFRGFVGQLTGPLDGEILQGDALFKRVSEPAP